LIGWRMRPSRFKPTISAVRSIIVGGPRERFGESR
jgi:hypothetical protein